MDAVKLIDDRMASSRDEDVKSLNERKDRSLSSKGWNGAFGSLKPDRDLSLHSRLQKSYFTSSRTPTQTRAAESQRRRSTFSCSRNLAMMAEQI